jgi:RND family efflux transporter MFP subunit
MAHVTLRRIAGLFPFIVLLTLAGCGDESAVDDAPPLIRPVLTHTVEAASAGLVRSYPASVLPAQEVELSFRVSGRLVELPIRAALDVSEGDIIGQLDTRDFESALEQLNSQIEQAEAQLRSMQAGGRAEEIARLEATVVAAEARLAEAQAQLDRTQQLFDQEFVAEAKLLQDQTAVRVAEADLNTAQESLTEGQAGARIEDVEAQEAAIRGLRSQLSTAQANLDDATLRAPFSGIIANREVDNFTNVSSGQLIAVLQRLDTIDLNFDMPGPDVVVFANAGDASSTVRIDAIPNQQFEARLVEFSTAADPTTQTFRTRVAIDRPGDVAILPGMVGTVTVSEGQSDQTIIEVPIGAVAADSNGQTFVWLVASPEHSLERRTVTTGAAQGDAIAIVEGLEAGEIIVIAGLSKLQPGMVVRPITEIGE